MGKLAEQIVRLARDGGGSFKTVHDRSVITKKFAAHLQKLNIQIRDVQHLSSKHVESFVQSRLEEGVSKRTMQNEMAALRVVLRKAGRDKLADSERISNSSLGLSGASRRGTKTAITQERYNEVLAAATKRDRGFAACLQLIMTIGLRSEEAVQADKSLKTWSKMLREGAERLPVTFGTKNGKLREVMIVSREQAIKAVTFALEVAKKNGGQLINKPNLKSAEDRFHNEARAVGLIGKNAPHSLRYAWAQERISAYQNEGFSKKEALARTSCDLGHGDGRGYYVKHVYCK